MLSSKPKYLYCERSQATLGLMGANGWLGGERGYVVLGGQLGRNLGQKPRWALWTVPAAHHVAEKGGRRRWRALL